MRRVAVWVPWDLFRPLQQSWWVLVGVPMLALLQWVAVSLAAYPVALAIGPFGLAVIAVTVLLRVALLPLVAWQVAGQIAGRRRALELRAELGPEIDRLSRRHRRDSLRFQAALAELCRERGIQPSALAGGGAVHSQLLPGLLQAPLLIAFYSVVLTLARSGGDLHFLWIGTLGGPDGLWVLPLVAGLTSYVLMRLAAKGRLPALGPAQPAAGLPLALIYAAGIVVWGHFLPAALALYWSAGNVFGIAQQLFVNKRWSSQASATSVS
jgi:YidC/Oxa1 family membrane protein insertase